MCVCVLCAHALVHKQRLPRILPALFGHGPTCSPEAELVVLAFYFLSLARLTIIFHYPTPTQLTSTFSLSLEVQGWLNQVVDRLPQQQEIFKMILAKMKFCHPVQSSCLPVLLCMSDF